MVRGGWGRKNGGGAEVTQDDFRYLALSGEVIHGYGVYTEGSPVKESS
jgi:hypothetical protein